MYPQVYKTSLATKGSCTCGHDHVQKQDAKGNCKKEREQKKLLREAEACNKEKGRGK